MQVDDIVKRVYEEKANWYSLGIEPNEIYLGTYTLNRIIAANMPVTTPVGSIKAQGDLMFMGLKVHEVLKPVDHIRVGHKFM
ncbi:hypothetical protein WMZ97_13130 [Lentibacillus sp. N15]|uniref:hypothetical protein n=1 Tax=Lentibacillus songyuanensis TaxID=3136161 RepID=UPI0031BB888E